MNNLRIGNYAFDANAAIQVAEKVGMALVILAITWILAKAAKWAFAKLVDNVGFLRRDTSSGESIGNSLGKIVSLLIWLFGLMAVLTVFNLGGVIAPIEKLLSNIMDFIPNLVGAALIFFIGLIIAGILRDLIVTALQTVDFDKWANRGGIDTATGNSKISTTIGTVIYALVTITVAILALEALNLEAISGPASDMLRIILTSIPNIIVAAIILAIGYLVSNFVVQLIKELLPDLGVDRALTSSGLVSAGTSASGIIARVVQVAIMLFFAIAATRMLGFPELTAILDQILELGGRVVFGAVVIGIGVLIANMISRLMDTDGDGGIASTVVRYVAIILFTFMGLEFMGVGDDIVRLAFGALVIGSAVAAALAFGLGGRETAGKVLEDLRENPPQPKAKKPAVSKPVAPKPAVKKPIVRE